MSQQQRLDPIALKTPKGEIIIKPFWSDKTGKMEYTLYLDGAWQLSTDKEAVYHESLAAPAFALAQESNSVAILGGGDGFLAKVLWKLGQHTKPNATRPYPSTVLCDYDAAMVRLFAEHPYLSDSNGRALTDFVQRCVFMDGREFVKQRSTSFDIVLMDYPSLGVQDDDENLLSLFSPEHFLDVAGILRPGGVLTAQFSCPWKRAVAIIRALLEQGMRVFGYCSYYEPGYTAAEEFLLAIKGDASVRRSLPPEMARITDEHVQSILETAEITQKDLRHVELFGGPSGLF